MFGMSIVGGGKISIEAMDENVYVQTYIHSVVFALLAVHCDMGNLSILQNIHHLNNDCF